MPGFFGFIKTNNTMQADFSKIRSTLLSNENIGFKEVLSDQYANICYTALKKSNLFDEHASKHLHVSVYGEIYNHEHGAKKIYHAYKNNSLNEFLASIDGYYNCIIYDKKDKKIFFISDRYGLKPLFIYHKKDDLAFCAEPKGLLSLEFVDREVDSKDFECFIKLGYFLENNSWNKYIKMISPATVLKLDLSTNKISQEYYWTWEEVGQNYISFENAVDKIGELFLESIRKRFSSEDQISVPLSGGLDSRLIMAAINKIYPNYNGYAYTFGTKDCDDILVAKEVAKKSNFAHQVFHFIEDNWFFPRIKEVFNSDGLYSMMHMHGIEFIDCVTKDTNISLNGFSGDLIVGDSYMGKHKVYLKEEFEFQLNHSRYLKTKKTDAFYLANHVRRLTHGAVSHGSLHTISRLPFVDIDIMDFIYSLPDEYRINYKLYKAMALKFFPQFYEDIPWQKTRETLDGRASSILPQTPISRGYMNYAGAIREKSILKFLYETLEYKNSLYQNYTDIDAVSSYLQPHIDDIQQNHIAKIFNFLTAEIYLRELHK